MIWLELEGGRGRERRQFDPPCKFICVELTAAEHYISGCDFLNKSIAAVLVTREGECTPKKTQQQP